MLVPKEQTIDSIREAAYHFTQDLSKLRRRLHEDRAGISEQDHQEMIYLKRLSRGDRLLERLREDWPEAIRLLAVTNYVDNGTSFVKAQFGEEVLRAMVRARLITVRPYEGVVRPDPLGKAGIASIRWEVGNAVYDRRQTRTDAIASFTQPNGSSLVSHTI